MTRQSQPIYLKQVIYLKAVIQRVKRASVSVENEVVSAIDSGLLILLGVAQGDTEHVADVLAEKTANLRIFSDSEDKMNLSLLTIGGDALVVSQFTLCANCVKGRRPDFFSAAKPDEAERLYEYFCKRIKTTGVNRVEKGVFGADMQVELLNDGPVTIILDTTELKK